ncbi:enoyl-CoA hydratase/isomerase family protein [Mucilaginibacter pallidiroseus]|uniref:Enoyl-CoA hydratase/isomerase family protein n=1 Tax=Mucilaginibacter pallidiroseus TaxID=2599295 RepID=A0A563U383_9SPHI|nr:enoyl-CoA hydratase/isomerase family protein [Mucilaginibacter pallidiroseus]TWR25804.1 enoyl-CoA hydratase/isomerase family protein [Mucilaginibacter pallidiroseus]
MNDNGEVNLVYNGGIATITFGHPAQNALPSHLLMQLSAAIEEAGSDTDTRVIIIQSAGERTFCAGASFNELLKIADEDTGTRFFSGFANVINACRKADKIIIAKVQGKAVGGGVGIAAAADYCFATEHAAVKLSELTIGIGPFVIAPAVQRKIGLPAFTQLSLQAGIFQSAEWAKENGLYNEVYEDATTMDDAIKQLAEQLANYNPEAITSLKRILWEGTEHWDTLLAERAAISGKLVLSEFTQKALRAFLSKA